MENPNAGIPKQFLKQVQFMEKYQETLKSYIRRCFAQCQNDTEKDFVSKKLLTKIKQVTTQQGLSTFNWTSEKLVPRSQYWEDQERMEQIQQMEQEKKEAYANKVHNFYNKSNFNQNRQNQGQQNSYDPNKKYGGQQQYSQGGQYKDNKGQWGRQTSYPKSQDQQLMMQQPDQNASGTPNPVSQPPQYQPYSQYGYIYPQYGQPQDSSLNSYPQQPPYAQSYYQQPMNGQQQAQSESQSQTNQNQQVSTQGTEGAAQPTGQQNQAQQYPYQYYAQYQYPYQNYPSNQYGQPQNQYNQTAPNQYNPHGSPNQYNQTAQNQYNQASPNQYTQTTQSQYNQTAQNQYNQTIPNQYTQQNPNQYNQNIQNQYNQPNSNQYNQNQYNSQGPQNQYNQADQNQYNQTAQNPYSQPQNMYNQQGSPNQFNPPQYNQAPNQYNQQNTYNQQPQNQYNQQEQSQNQFSQQPQNQFNPPQYDQTNQYNSSGQQNQYNQQRYDHGNQKFVDKRKFQNQRPPYNKNHSNQSEEQPNPRDDELPQGEITIVKNSHYGSDDEGKDGSRKKFVFKDKFNKSGNSRYNKGRFQDSISDDSHSKETHFPAVVSEQDLDEMISEKRIIGTSQALEKQYLRITGGTTDPKDFRPLDVLKKSLEFCMEKFEATGDYRYISDQLRSIRQDISVQNIEDKFCVQVYELHIRLAIDHNDWENFNQVQSNLELLYQKGLGERENMEEMYCYHILFLCDMNDVTGFYQFIPRIDESLLKSDMITFAINVWKASSQNDWITFFKMMKNAPKQCSKVMQKKAIDMRYYGLEAIRKSLKAPHPYSVFRELLLFDTEEETKEYLKKANVLDSVIED